MKGPAPPFELDGAESGWMGDPKRGAAMGRRGRKENPDSLSFTLRKVALDSGGYDKGGAYWGHGDALYWYSSQCGKTDGYFRLEKPNLINRSYEVCDRNYYLKEINMPKGLRQKTLLKEFPEEKEYVGYTFTADRSRNRYLAKLHVSRMFPGATFTR
jgi:hypothetical protein